MGQRHHCQWEGLTLIPTPQRQVWHKTRSIIRLHVIPSGARNLPTSLQRKGGEPTRDVNEDCSRQMGETRPLPSFKNPVHPSSTTAGAILYPLAKGEAEIPRSARNDSGRSGWQRALGMTVDAQDGIGRS